MAENDFWNDQEKAKGIIAEMKSLKAVLEPFKALGAQADDLQVMMEMAEETGDNAFDSEIADATRRATADFETFELRRCSRAPTTTATPM